MGELWRKLVFLFHRRQLEQELEEEMRSHAAMTGSPQFGNLTLLREEGREMWGFGALERLIQDLRFAFRMLRKSPAFTAVAVLSLALGIGANTAIFSLINAVLLRSLPVQHPEQLVALSYADFEEGGYKSYKSFPYPFYRDLRDHSDALSDVICQTGMPATLSIHGSAERVTGEMVSGNYFEALGVRPYAGRLFRSGDETVAGADRVVVLSYGFWKRRFAGDRSIIGTVVDLNTTPFTIIGVSPPGFDGLRAGFSPDLRVPPNFVDEPMLTSRLDWWLTIVGRLKPGITRMHAEAALTASLHDYVRQSDQAKSAFRRKMLESRRISLVSAATGLETRAKGAAKQLYLLMAVVALVLLIACVNIANLLLARTAARQREIAVRLSLGAGRKRLIRQLLTESVLLAVIGGIVGIVFAVAGARLLLAFLVAGQKNVSLDVTPDARVLAFTLGLSLLTGILFGIAPAFRSTRLELATELKGEQSRLPGTRIMWRKALVSLQVGLSLILLIGAGLFLRSLVKLRTMDTGFEKENVLELSMDPTLSGYQRRQSLAFYRQIAERVSHLPGVLSASFAAMPLISDSDWGSGITVQGYQPKEDDMGPNRNIVGPGYFTTLHIPMILGRDFGPRDNENSPHVAIVNETFARFYFGGQSPIGKVIGAGDKRGPFDFAIVGVAKDGKYASLREQTPRFWYIPYEQHPDASGLTLYVRTARDPLKETDTIRQAIRNVDANVAVFNVKTLAEQINENIATDRIVATLSVFFSLLAALIAAIGLYGVMTYVMTKRTREIGIRVALGAQRTTVIESVMREVALLVAIGIVVGVPCALVLGKFVASMLFEVKPADELTLLAASALAITVTLIAGYLPARRAAHVDPMTALRYD